MSLIDVLNNTKVSSELKDNQRLQWLLLVVALILVVSLTKSLNSKVTQKKIDLKEQITYLNKLKGIGNTELDTEQQLNITSVLSEALAKIPKATSLSTAEAQALTLVENSFTKHFSRMRLNLIGSETLNFGDLQFFSVRIDIAGNISDKSFIQVLEEFENNRALLRLVTLRNSSKTRGSSSLVIDVLYMGSNDG